MTQRDRSNQDRARGQPPRRNPSAGDRTPSPGEVRRYTADEDTAFDLPPWPGSAGRDRQEHAFDDPGARPPRETQRDPRSTRTRGGEPIPRLGDAFDRGNRRPEFPDDDRAGESMRDPYDRLRRVAGKPPRAVQIDAGEPEFLEEGAGYSGVPPVPRERPRGRRPATTVSREERSPPVRPAPGRQFGDAIAAATPHTRFLAGVAGIALLSLTLMAASVAGRIGSLPDWVPIHLNAEGAADRYGTPSTLWRVPLMAFMLTLMSACLAFYLANRDPFASRFALTSTMIIHAMTWIALIHLLW